MRAETNPRERPRAPRWIGGLALVACGATLVASASASADEPAAARGAYVIAIAQDDGARPTVGRLGATARRVLRTQPGVDYAAADEAYLGIGQVARQRLTEAASLLESGRQSYENVELGDAITALTASIEAFEGAAGALEDPGAFGDALLFLGAAQTLSDQSTEARRTFARLHVLDPRRRPDPNVFPPDIVSRFERAAPRDARNPTASIEVTSEPAGAEVFVDGVARGPAPATATNLVGGQHMVRVVMPGHATFFEMVNVRAGGSTSVRATLEAGASAETLAGALGRLQEGGSLETALRSLGRALDVDLLLVLGISGQPGDLAIDGAAYDTSSGRRLAHQTVTASGTAEDIDGAVEQLTAQLTRSGLQSVGASSVLPRVGPRRRRAERRQGPEGGGSPAIYERWWFWTAVGVVAVGATVGIVAAASSGEDRHPGLDQQGQVVLEF